MKVLIMEWNSFGQEDIVDAYQSLGYDISTMQFDNHGELYKNIVIENDISHSIEIINPDFVFSFNYFPIISSVCNKLNVKYVSWVYDNPQVLMYSCTIINPCNIVFTFDKSQCDFFNKNRINTVHYLPLAANTSRLSKMSDYAGYLSSPWANKTDISFIGSLYTESHQFYNRLTRISDYTRGFLEGIIAAQKQVYGYNFVEDMLIAHPSIVEDMTKDLPLSPEPTSVITKEQLFAQYVINRQITAIERSEFLSAIGQNYSYDLYTVDNSISLPGCINHGKVDYYNMAPYVFKNSKINLNFTLRSITSGIPLRCFDILGAGGFLLTNYQNDFADCYIANEDYVFFDSKEDLIDKINYYLVHDKERKEIAMNGLNRTIHSHNYINRLQEIEEYL